MFRSILEASASVGEENGFWKEYLSDSPVLNGSLKFRSFSNNRYREKKEKYSFDESEKIKEEKNCFCPKACTDKYYILTKKAVTE
ncbi:hypothetical protein CEXT_249271 [Caerostris extrusa]|uniref:Uncharacterized protein n=1 Tax=Caerostris extrusa TaxID=172846 RepID=A0AAV4SH18_CAEEX|nr:hypothetical protein CEXT_249271 [Caerostris extrusa]